MGALALVLLAVWSFAVALAGGIVGLVLGNLRLPVVVGLASSPAVGAGSNVVISGIAAASSALAHWRAGRLDWRLLAWLAPTSLVGGIAGGLLSGALPGRLLLVVIAFVVLYGSIDWALVAVGGAASIPGALLGARFVGRLSERELLRAAAIVCAIAGVAMLAAAIAGE